MRQSKKPVRTWNIHPGEILREDFLKPLDMSSYHLAKRLGVPVPRIHDIVLEKRGITADTAVRLARRAQKELGPVLSRIVPRQVA